MKLFVDYVKEKMQQSCYANTLILSSHLFACIVNALASLILFSPLILIFYFQAT